MGIWGSVAILAGGVLGLSLVYWALRIWRGRSFLRRWARKQGWELVESKWCWDGGPFSLTEAALLGPRFDAYRVTVVRGGGKRRVGYVKCGTWLGLGLTPMVLFEVRWESEPGVVEKDRWI